MATERQSSGIKWSAEIELQTMSDNSTAYNVVLDTGEGLLVRFATVGRVAARKLCNALNETSWIEWWTKPKAE